MQQVELHSKNIKSLKTPLPSVCLLLKSSAGQLGFFDS